MLDFLLAHMHKGHDEGCRFRRVTLFSNLLPAPTLSVSQLDGWRLLFY